MPRRAQDADAALAAELRELRESRGLSQEAVAHAAGLTMGSYARIELRQSSPSWVTVRQIARALDVSMAELSRAVERRP